MSCDIQEMVDIIRQAAKVLTAGVNTGQHERLADALRGVATDLEQCTGVVYDPSIQNLPDDYDPGFGNIDPVTKQYIDVEGIALADLLHDVEI